MFYDVILEILSAILALKNIVPLNIPPSCICTVNLSYNFSKFVSFSLLVACILQLLLYFWLIYYNRENLKWVASRIFSSSNFVSFGKSATISKLFFTAPCLNYTNSCPSKIVSVYIRA